MYIFITFGEVKAKQCSFTYPAGVEKFSSLFCWMSLTGDKMPDAPWLLNRKRQ